MNIFKSLGKLVWGDASNPDLVQITSGQFYSYKPRDGPSSRECLYIDAMATIRRTSQPYQYLLAINRVFEEGEEGLQDEEQDLDDGRSFLIDEHMRFRKGMTNGASHFSWDGMATEDAGLAFQFVCDEETTSFTVNNFEITAYQCMYERKHQKSHFSAEEEAFEEFQIKSPASSPKAERSTRVASPRASRPPPAVKVEKKPVVKKDEEANLIDKPLVRKSPTSYDGVAEASGELHLFDPRSNEFMLQAQNVRCQLLRATKFTYWIVVESKEGQQLLAQQIEPRMNPVFNSTHHSFIWNYFDDQHNVYSWLIRFSDQETMESFQGTFGECMYETLNQDSWAKVAAPDQEYMIRTYQEDVDMAGRDDDEESQYSSDEESERGSGDEDEESEDEKFVSSGNRDDSIKNSQLAVGYKDRSFVVRGSKIGVFRHNESDGLDFDTTIKNLSNAKGKEVLPSRVLLHEQDTSMVLMDKTDQNTAYKMDLEYGKIVEEWNMPGTSGVLNIVGDSKYAHMSGNKTLIGLSKDSMFKIDPRLSGSKIAEEGFKQYAKGNNFTCATTTTNGSLAVAGQKGDIKLFNVLGKNAKTAIPALGDPIIGIDATGNGRYVIATCKNYILLIDVLNPENKKLGFDASFPAKAKPTPIKLQLRPQHVASMKQAVSFTPARFNTGVNEEEKTIVTSTGPYVITWNFRRVKNGHYDYQIKRYDDNVVADNFKFGQDRSIIVALPHDVTALAKRNLTSPDDAFKQAGRKRQ